MNISSFSIHDGETIRANASSFESTVWLSLIDPNSSDGFAINVFFKSLTKARMISNAINAVQDENPIGLLETLAESLARDKGTKALAEIIQSALVDHKRWVLTTQMLAAAE